MDVPPRISVLEHDDELDSRLGPDQARLARDLVRAPVVEVASGPWSPLSEWTLEIGSLGLLVLEGFVIRDVVLVGRHASELLGRRDLLRPSEHDGAGAPLPFDVEWTVVEPARLAIIDRAATAALGRWPELTGALMSRAIQRTHALAVRQAIGQIIRIDARLLAFFWHLADRWGHVEREGVVVPLRLTHEMGARLAGAQRPSVTIALGELAERGVLVRRANRTWRLTGDPPRDVGRLTRSEGRGARPVATPARARTSR